MFFAIGSRWVARLFAGWFIRCLVCSFVRLFVRFSFVCSFVSWCVAKHFPVLLEVQTLKTVEWRFLLSENDFVIFTVLKSCGPPWSPVVLLVLSRCPALFLVVCCVICAIPLSPVVPCRPCFPMVLRVPCLCLPLLLYLVFF